MLTTSKPSIHWNLHHRQSPIQYSCLEKVPKQAGKFSQCVKGPKLGGKATRAAAASLSVTLGGNNEPLYNSLSAMSSNEGPKPLDSGNTGPSFQDIDPSASGQDITVIHAPEEFEKIKEANPTRLVCLMCKALGCRPCKMFARKYQRVAASNKDTMFLEVTGDESTELRKLMIQLGIRATPTFKFFCGGECILTHTGIDEAKLRASIDKCQEMRAESGAETA